MAIIAPHDEEHNYLNRKRYHSKNVQIVCDPDLKILMPGGVEQPMMHSYGGTLIFVIIWKKTLVIESKPDHR